MANNCDTSYRITGSETAVNDLWQTLQSMEVESHNVWLSQLAEHYHIDFEKRQIHVRGHIYFASLEDNILTIETDTAWNGCHDLFHAINKELKGALSISYMEVEPGCEIYYIHDEGTFFPYECCVSSYGSPFEDVYADPHETIAEAIRKWCTSVSFERGDHSEEEMLEIIDGYEYEDEDTYFYIHPFTHE